MSIVVKVTNIIFNKLYHYKICWPDHMYINITHSVTHKIYKIATPSSFGNKWNALVQVIKDWKPEAILSKASIIINDLLCS